MVKSIEQERVRELLRETITVLCRNGLQFKEEFSVEALIGITLDKDDVFLVSIKENVNLADEEMEAIESLSDDSLAQSTDNQPKRKRKKKSRNGEDIQGHDTSAPVEKRVKTIPAQQQSSEVKHEPSSQEHHMESVQEIVGVTDQAAWSEQQAVTQQIIEPAPTANMTAENPILEITAHQQPTHVQVQPQMIMAADPNSAAVQGMQANNVLMEIAPQQVIQQDQQQYATTSAQEPLQDQYIDEEDEEDEEEEYEEYAEEGEDAANQRSSGGFNDDPHTRPYGCRSCDYTSQRTYNLRRHVESYGHNGYMCNICVKIYNRKMWFVFLPDLKKHVGKEHREEQQAAANRRGATSLGTPRSTSPRRVVRKSGGVRKGMDESFEGYTQLHICMECNTPFPDKQSLIRHFTAEHTVLQPKLYQCVKCKKYFDTEFKLKQHSATEHVQSGFKYQCTDCDAEFAEKSELKDHVHNEHRQLPVEGIIHCEDCGKEFKTNVAFKRHAATCGAE